MPLPPFIVPSIHYKHKAKAYKNSSFTEVNYKKKGGSKKTKTKSKTKSKKTKSKKTKSKNDIETISKKVKIKTYTSYN